MRINLLSWGKNIHQLRIFATRSGWSKMVVDRGTLKMRVLPAIRGSICFQCVTFGERVRWHRHLGKFNDVPGPKLDLIYLFVLLLCCHVPSLSNQWVCVRFYVNGCRLTILYLRIYVCPGLRHVTMRHVYKIRRTITIC